MNAIITESIKSKIDELLSEIPTAKESSKRFEDLKIEYANEKIANYNKYREPFIVFMLKEIKCAVSKLRHKKDTQKLQMENIDDEFYDIVIKICNCKIIGCESLFIELCKMIKPIGYNLYAVGQGSICEIRVCFIE